VDADAGSAITATGPLTLGSSSWRPASLDGVLTRSHVVVRDLDAIELGSSPRCRGTSIIRMSCASGSATISRERTVSASLRNNGLITWAARPAHWCGNSYVNSLFGVLEAELGNHATGEQIG
jgi:hypothetical protein